MYELLLVNFSRKKTKIMHRKVIESFQLQTRLFDVHWKRANRGAGFLLCKKSVAWTICHDFNLACLLHLRSSLEHVDNKRFWLAYVLAPAIWTFQNRDCMPMWMKNVSAECGRPFDTFCWSAHSLKVAEVNWWPTFVQYGRCGIKSSPKTFFWEEAE